MRVTYLWSIFLLGFFLGVGGVHAQTKKFSEAELKFSGKKGACLTLRAPKHNSGGTVIENMPKVKALNPSWNYSWGTERVADQPESIEFVPMVWRGSRVEEMKKRLATDVVSDIKTDKEEQANMPYTKALELWPTLEKLGIPLCSPACANPEGVDDSVQGVPGTWMRDFMKEADKRRFRVDYIGVHWYGGTNAESFKVKLKRIYEKYGKRPLLITEFAPTDWKLVSCMIWSIDLAGIKAGYLREFA
jgi:hypothetical protein